MAIKKQWQQKIVPPEILSHKIKILRKEGKSIATLNGSFDLLHAGHLHIINEASKVCDILLVALNTDRSIKEYKHPLRPIIPLEYRLQMMSALGCVDLVTWFDETDPCRLLNEIKPDIHVNGAEYGENCIEKETVIKNGGKMYIVNLVPGLSTSEIIKKIKTLCD